MTEEGDILVGVAAMFVNNNVKIGDVVTGYSFAGNSTTSHTTDGKENTAPSGTETATGTKQTITRVNNLVWRYMGLDENGNALIVADSTGSLTKMQLSGKGGYLNGPAELNNACEALYSSNMGTARSINMDDVTRVLEYTGPLGTYLADGNKQIKTSIPLKISEIEEKEKHTLSNRETPDGSNIGEYKSNAIWVESSDENIKANTTAKNLMYTVNDYWLATNSIFVRFGGNCAHFGCFVMGGNSGLYPTTTLHSWTNGGSYEDYAVRPVVSLNPSVQITYDGTTVTLK